MEKLHHSIMTEAAEAGRPRYSFKIAMILRPSFTDFAMIHQSIQTGTERNKRGQPEGLLKQKRRQATLNRNQGFECSTAQNAAMDITRHCTPTESLHQVSVT